MYMYMYIIYDGAHSVGLLYQAQSSLGATERERRWTYTIRIRSRALPTHRAPRPGLDFCITFSTLYTVSGVVGMAGGPEREEEELLLTLCHLKNIE